MSLVKNALLGIALSFGLNMVNTEVHAAAPPLRYVYDLSKSIINAEIGETFNFDGTDYELMYRRTTPSPNDVSQLFVVPVNHPLSPKYFEYFSEWHMYMIQEPGTMETHLIGLGIRNQ